jgi:hypothetical protein
VVVCLVALSVVLFEGTVSVVSAQTSNPRVRGPFAGLFGGGPGVSDAQALNFRTSLFGVWQDVLVPANFDTSLLDPAFTKSGTFAGATAALDYFFNRHSQNSTLFFGGSGWASDYSVNPDKPQYGAQANGGFSYTGHITRRLTWNNTAAAAYSPFFEATPIPIAQAVGVASLPFSPTPGFGVPGVGASNVQATATSGLSQMLSRRSSISANLFAQEVHFFSQSNADLTQLGSQVYYTYRIFRNLTFHAGYTRTQARLGGDAWTPPVQSGDFGLDYGDALKFQLTRRTTLAVTAALGSARGFPGGLTQYRILGSAVLTHLMGRTFVASLMGARGLGFVAAFREPVLTDTAMASFGGQLATRFVWNNQASVTRGYIGLDQSRHYDSISALSGISYGITRRLAMFAQYLYYRSTLPPGSSPLIVLTNFDRQSVTAGLTLYQPIFNTQRTR